MRQLMHTIFITDNHSLFDLWRKKNLVNYQRVPKYCTITTVILAEAAVLLKCGHKLVYEILNLAIMNDLTFCEIVKYTVLLKYNI